MAELNDHDCPDSIRNFVRKNTDIDVYKYHDKGGLNGEVYYGKRIKLGDEVVLKFYWSHANYDETEEAVILRGIDHDNILKIYDLKFIEPYYALFLTPKISGGDLQELIFTQKFSSHDSLNIVAGILKGLTELHSKHNLVHRDLKPANILWNVEKEIPIIADLGAVKKVSDSNNCVNASKATYYYLPPESILSNQYYYQSDIYQVGVILFQLLNGKFPINDPIKWLNSREKKEIAGIKNEIKKHHEFEKIIANKIVKGKIINTNTLPKYLDSNFKRVINKSCHVNYSNRYLNAAEFLQKIHSLIHETPDYKFEDAVLNIIHDNGKKYKIYKGNMDNYVVEKCANKTWRKVNIHDGTLKSVLEIARQC